MKIANAVFLLATLSSVAASETPFLRASVMNGENSKPKDSSSGNSADKNVYLDDYEEASDYDYVLESSVDTTEAGSGVYLQTEVASNHGKRCRLPFPTACGENSQCMRRKGLQHAICVDKNKCIPARVVTSLKNGSRCCNGAFMCYEFNEAHCL